MKSFDLFALCALLLWLLPLSLGRVVRPLPEDLPDFGITLTTRGDFDNSSIAWTPPPPASDEQWNNYIGKGCRFLAMMAEDDETAGSMMPTPQSSAASPFTDFESKFQ